MSVELGKIFAVAAEQLGLPPETGPLADQLDLGTITTLSPIRLAGALKPKELLDSAALLCRGFSLDETPPLTSATGKESHRRAQLDQLR